MDALAKVRRRRRSAGLAPESVRRSTPLIRAAAAPPRQRRQTAGKPGASLSREAVQRSVDIKRAMRESPNALACASVLARKGDYEREYVG